MTAPPAPEPPPEEPPGGQGPPAFEGGTRKAMEVLALAFVFPVATYLGFRAGHWVGEKLGAAVIGGILGGALGAGAGFWELFRVLRRTAA